MESLKIPPSWPTFPFFISFASGEGLGDFKTEHRFDGCGLNLILLSLEGMDIYTSLQRALENVFSRKRA